MPVVFEKSAESAALHSVFEALIPAFVGGVFAALFWFVDDAPLILQIACLLAALLGAFMTLATLGKAISYRRNGKGWRVEISETALSWTSPSPKIMETFQVELKQIKELRRERHEKVGSEMDPTLEYFINLNDGRTITISRAPGTINPEKIFDVLGKNGVTYTKKYIRTGRDKKVTETEDHNF